MNNVFENPADNIDPNHLPVISEKLFRGAIDAWANKALTPRTNQDWSANVDHRSKKGRGEAPPN